MISWPWRCAVVLLVLLLALLGALAYHERQPSPVHAIWSSAWMGHWWPTRPVQPAHYALP